MLAISSSSPFFNISLKTWKTSFSFFFDLKDINRVSSREYWNTIAASANSNRLSKFIYRTGHDIFFILFGNSYLTNLVSNILLVFLNSVSFTFVFSINAKPEKEQKNRQNERTQDQEQEGEEKKAKEKKTSSTSSSSSSTTVTKRKKKKSSTTSSNDYEEDIILTIGFVSAEGKERLSEMLPGI